MGDEIGNTPLHTAAMLGNVKMYRCIAEVEKRLIGARNKDSDTHFFLVASHGHKHAFLCLHSLCGSREGYNYSKSNNGETILHSAIAGDYFDLAFQIIHHYEELVNSVNDRGLSPIHLLAAKPSAFRRGSNNIRKIWEKKPNNTWSIQVMNELLKRVSMYEYKNDGKKPLQPQSQPGDDSLDQETIPYTFDAVSEVTLAEDALHIPPTSNVSGANQHQQKAAEGPQDKNQTENKEGTLEMKKKESPILKALHDYMNYQKKNVVLLAMENRQPHVYQLLVKMNENKEEISEMEKIESPILIAAKNGITEIVEKILEKFPIALYDINYEKKNVVLLAVENRPTKCVSAVTKDDKHERKLRVPTSG
ncbi:hypothetical protein LWI28_023203 [Acer negundo]|uniref:Uncharacterized protein n=1 Tax=Acer negundo TaxID=4023 RepID=A0AAD5J158_ACENE|nr:hypothetical protein LWI28_023203 [Acer negundo]